MFAFCLQQRESIVDNEWRLLTHFFFWLSFYSLKTLAGLSGPLLIIIVSFFPTDLLSPLIVKPWYLHYLFQLRCHQLALNLPKQNFKIVLSLIIHWRRADLEVWYWRLHFQVLNSDRVWMDYWEASAIRLS